MREERRGEIKPGLRLMLQAVAAAALLSTLALPARAQSGRERQQQEAERVQQENERDLEERIFNLGTLSKRAGRSKRRDPNLTPAQLQEDFTRLQVLNNDLAGAVSRGGALDLKSVTKSAAEIKERAQRLKENLALPEPKKEEKRPELEAIGDQEQLKRALAALDELINGFAHNPAFREARPDDAELSAKARRDLEGIIELSGRIKEGGEKLFKAAQKSQ